MLRTLGLAIAAAVLLAGCGGGSGEPASKTAPSPTHEAKTTPKSKFDGAAYAKALAKDFRDAMGGAKISSMCDAAYTHWACFYEGIEATSKSTIRVSLATDGGWSDSDLDQLADEAALHWFNFIGEAHEDLDTVIVRVNGRDTNHYRRDIPLLNR